MYSLLQYGMRIFWLTQLTSIQPAQLQTGRRPQEKVFRVELLARADQCRTDAATPAAGALSRAKLPEGPSPCYGRSYTSISAIPEPPSAPETCAV